MMLSKNF